MVALWREGLLARKVLLGQTIGYRHHPQLSRFKAQLDPVAAIDYYLWVVHAEAVQRGYRFDGSKLGARISHPKIPVTAGQLQYEFEHLKRKLAQRDLTQLQKIVSIAEPAPHPLFEIILGEADLH